MEQKENQLKNSAKYRKTEKGKAAAKRDEQSSMGKARHQKYLKTENGWLKHKVRCKKYAEKQKKIKFSDRFKRQKEVSNILDKYFNEKGKREETFFNLRDSKTNRKLRVDIHYPKNNIIIEINGAQHYIPVRFGNISQKKAQENLENYQRREYSKQKYCIERNIKFLTIPYNIPLELIEEFVKRNQNGLILIVRKEFSFAYSHRLHNEFISDEDNKQIFGKCNNKNHHGHNMKVIIEVKGFVNPLTGMVINFVDMKKIVGEYINNVLDHTDFNLDHNDYKIDVSTCENTINKMLEVLSKELPIISKIRVYETPTSYAEIIIDSLNRCGDKW